MTGPMVVGLTGGIGSRASFTANNGSGRVQIVGGINRGAIVGASEVEKF